ncbi:hydrolase [Sphingobium sp.]|uniref:hydrolase n=1 Tax=Sphingobium sp. TaxID=1912891 RepID=UPI002C372040|nr:hydrolase [Sphingobium sp.]HUD95516.1 hydrolase [Sphingobium sp.]
MDIDPTRTALVAIDLQKGIVASSTAPHASADVVARSRAIADALRAAGGTVVLVTVDFHKGFVDALAQPADIASPRSPDGPPADFADIVPELGAHDGDLRIIKRQWGAFHGTELDLQLRRRGIDTIILTGIATHMGVESTARSAWEHGYRLIFAEDAIASFSDMLHDFPIAHVFPRLGHVRTSKDVVAALS